ncbi:hypothetical protein ISF6_4097 [Piscinibacter sakaiensis]|uniref:Uncharacterized protein n=2 Tax=Piscinibacter sakaiensis TaxID=1547922 RepID=A0A0K8P5B5_PISS1|nr:hypothetical protein ISF6_4097 [Piscinibacter sakaiensis]
MLLALALLAGCAARPPARVEIPIAVPCRVTLPPRPVYATEALSSDAGIYDQVRALLAERRQRMAYEAQLEAAARACS